MLTGANGILLLSQQGLALDADGRVEPIDGYPRLLGFRFASTFMTRAFEGTFMLRVPTRRGVCRFSDISNRDYLKAQTILLAKDVPFLSRLSMWRLSRLTVAVT